MKGALLARKEHSLKCCLVAGTLLGGYDSLSPDFFSLSTTGPLDKCAFGSSLQHLEEQRAHILKSTSTLASEHTSRLLYTITRATHFDPHNSYQPATTTHTIAGSH